MNDHRPVALVTGAGNGIGRAVALSFGQAGYNVGVLDLDRDSAESAASEIRDLGVDAGAWQCDVSDASSIEGAVRNVVAEFGALHAAVNNAGLGTKAVDIIDLDESDWDLIMNVDLKGLWYSLRAEIPLMLESGGGSIVNMASVYGLVGTDDISPAYVAAKHGVVGLTRCAALQYADRGIRVNAICPGVIDTPGVAARLARTPGDAARRKLESLQPMDRMGLPGEIAESAVWLCDKRSGFVTGAAIPVDGGLTAR